MARRKIVVAMMMHETNTFSPVPTRLASFRSLAGAAAIEEFRDTNTQLGGFLGVAQKAGAEIVVPIAGGAHPSGYVEKSAYEDMAEAIVGAVRSGCDAAFLALHGAMVAEHTDDGEGELLRRVRAVAPRLPIAVGLDFHAHMTSRMIDNATVITGYRTYPHVDMAETGERAAGLLARRLAAGTREKAQARRLPFLIPLNAQSTWVEPAKRIYDELAAVDRDLGTVSSFCMGFPASDFDECAPMLWSHGARAETAASTLFARAADPAAWQLEILPAKEAVVRALALAEAETRPVVVADTQDNPGAGGDSNTTGLLHALLAQGAGRRFPGQVALGLMFDPAAARAALEAGIGAELDIALGTAVPTFTGQASDPPVRGRFKVLAVADGVCTLTGPMMHGLTVRLGPSACLELDGIRIAVVSGKKQLLDRALLRMVGIHAEQMRIIVVKSSNHFRADFQPIACRVLIAKAAGPMAADPAELPWKKLPATIRRRP